MTTIPKAPPWACGPRAQRDPQPLDALVGRVESSGESSRVAEAPFRRTPGVSIKYGITLFMRSKTLTK